MDLLPSVVPDNLSAKEYYELGLRYRLAGWVGLARESLSKVLQLDKSGRYLAKTRRVLKTQLPRLPVPAEAEQRNIEGFNLMESDRQSAKLIFEGLMRQYPDFEWPFSNMAHILLAEGSSSQAKGIAKYLLSVNQDLLRAVQLMIDITLAERNFDEVLTYVGKALELYPEDHEFRQLQLAIKMEKEGLPSDTIPDNLTAREYYDMGVQYQMLGRFELARKSLELAMGKEPSGSTAEQVTKFLRTKMPKVSIPADISPRYEEGIKLISTDREAAKAVFERLIADLPEFEMPYCILASIYLSQRNPAEAEKLIMQVLAASPDFFDAKLLIINLYMMEKKFKSATDFIDQALKDMDSPDDGLDLDMLKAHCQLYARA